MRSLVVGPVLEIELQWRLEDGSRPLLRGTNSGKPVCVVAVEVGECDTCNRVDGMAKLFRQAAVCCDGLCI